MELPTLQYVTFFDKDQSICTADSLELFVTKPLVQKGLVQFRLDSEIFEFCHTSFRGGPGKRISACISPINEQGENTPVNAYYTCCKDSIHERTRDAYSPLCHPIKGAEEDFYGEGIFPLLMQTDGQRGAGLFPSDGQKMQIEKLLGIYLEANPDPHLRLAVVSGTNPSDAANIEAVFKSMAEKYAQLERIEL